METSTNEIRPPFSPAEGDAISAGDPRGSLQPPAQQTLIYGIAIFASAFLLFQVQPLITKIILPWFGGVAAVWTVCLVFFQVALLLGYLYAHVLTTRISLPKQGRIHAALLALSLIALPILPRVRFKPTGSGDPTWHILMLLAATIGLPYLVLSSTSPLLQAWYRKAGQSAFRTASTRSRMPGRCWRSLAIRAGRAETHEPASGLGMVLCLRGCGRGLCGAGAATAQSCEGAGKFRYSWKARLENPDSVGGSRPCGSSLLLAVTNHVSQNIASVPFLWVIPLSLYLLSFILCFDRKSWYRRGICSCDCWGLHSAAWLMPSIPRFAVLPMKVLIPVYCAGLWVCCMFCHGELARLKPDPTHLNVILSDDFPGRGDRGRACGNSGSACVLRLLRVAVRRGAVRAPCVVSAVPRSERCVRPERLATGRIRAGRAWLWRSCEPGHQCSRAERRSRRTERNFYGVLRVTDHDGADGRDGADCRQSDENRQSGDRAHAPLYLIRIRPRIAD